MLKLELRPTYFMLGLGNSRPGMKLSCHSQIALVGLLFCLCALPVKANVYATDIRLNGSLQPVIILPGGNLTISYILNDTASGGVWVWIYYGTNLVKTLASTNGTAATNTGLNSAVWNGPTNLAAGVYTVSITAASAGYATWTNITDDGPNFSVAVPRGISVNQNTNSPFYGRVFVADTYTQFGIFKYNADGSPGDEGGFSTGGLMWGAGTDFPKYSPWKMIVSLDDKVYIDDFSGNGVVYEFDQIIATNCHLVAVGADNYPLQDPEPQLSGLAVSGRGANTQIWMTDARVDDPGGLSAGIISWPLATNGIAAPYDPGTVIVPLNTNFLAQAPYDIALDSNGFIYTIEFITSTNNPDFPLMCFPPYHGQPETNAAWAVGSGDPALMYAYGVAVDPTATYVAVAVVGPCPDTENSPCGGLNLYTATKGEYLTNLDQTGGDAYYDVAWDRVGNLYALDGTAGVWRAYSPPGTNQATTVAVPLIQAYNALLPSRLSNPAASGGALHFTLTGQSNVTYIIQRSMDLSNWASVATNYSPDTNRPISMPICGNQNFYRAVTSP